MSARTAKVVISNEALVLRQMRIKAGLSMRKVGGLIGVSDSYISQIENGRMDVRVPSTAIRAFSELLS